MTSRDYLSPVKMQKNSHKHMMVDRSFTWDSRDLYRFYHLWDSSRTGEFIRGENNTCVYEYISSQAYKFTLFTSYPYTTWSTKSYPPTFIPSKFVTLGTTSFQGQVEKVYVMCYPNFRYIWKMNIAAKSTSRISTTMRFQRLSGIVFVPGTYSNSMYFKVMLSICLYFLYIVLL